MLTLYQAEWCPFSSAVRERLTELGVDVIVRQVAPWPEQRTQVDEIPALDTDDDTRITGTRAIFDYLRGFDEPEFAAAHRKRYVEHAPARTDDAAGTILERAAPGGHVA